MKAVIPTNYQIIMEKSGSTITWEMRETSAYKVLNRGTMAVSDLEILATFVEDHGVAKNLLEAFRSLRNLATANMRELMEIEGVDMKHYKKEIS